MLKRLTETVRCLLWVLGPQCCATHECSGNWRNRNTYNKFSNTKTALGHVRTIPGLAGCSFLNFGLQAKLKTSRANCSMLARNGGKTLSTSLFGRASTARGSVECGSGLPSRFQSSGCRISRNSCIRSRKLSATSLLAVSFVRIFGTKGGIN